MNISLIKDNSRLFYQISFIDINFRKNVFGIVVLKLQLGIIEIIKIKENKLI